jgi:UDP-N-acetylmuramyl tripeptide synthase
MVWGRSQVALVAGAAASGASRLLRRGSGEVIGGKIAMGLAPDLLAELGADRVAACVSGTNGKTTTTRLLAAAMATRGPVASNAGGANMPAGHVSALAQAPRNWPAVLEVDEVYLPQVVATVRPEVVVLLNISRDQLDRMAETRRIVAAWRGMTLEPAKDGQTAPVVVANADDPLVTWAAMPAGRVVWVAAGLAWRSDAAICPSCGDLLDFSAEAWVCTQCPLRRPEPQVSLRGNEVSFGTEWLPVDLVLPGRANRGNAAMAAAAAQVLGVKPADALAAMRTVTGVQGRYAVHRRPEASYRLFLAKNPAGWVEIFDMLAETDRPLVFAINARTADGKDTSWLWDVPFEKLRGRHVVATGERGVDLALRLAYAEVDHDLVPVPADALRAAKRRRRPPADGTPDIDVVGNYTSFQALRGEVAS